MYPKYVLFICLFTLKVKWMECQKYDNGEEYGIPSGFVRLSSGTFKKGFDHQGSIFRASATVNATVDEVMSILMCESTGSLNSAYREICSDFLGGEVLVNVQPRDIINDYKHPQVPLCTIKRLCFSPGSKWSPRDFIVREYCTLDIDNDSGTEMGVITWNHTSLNEVENIKISSCIRGKILEGSGFVVKCCKDASSMSELVFILRVDLGKQKLGLGRSEKKASARIAHMVAGVYAQVESYVERYGSVSQAKGKGFDEAIKLVNTDGEALQAAATISGNAEKIKQRLGAEVIKKETVEIEIEEEIDDDISSEESGSSPRGTPTNLKDIDFEPIDDNDIDMTQAPPSLVLKNASTGAEVRTSKPKWRKAVASIIAGNAVENISRLYRERLKEKEMEKLELEEKLKRLEEETREQLKRLEEQQQKQAEERALIVAAAESTAVARSGNDSRSSSPTGKDEDLETLVENLQKQLENMKVQHEKMKILLKEAHGTTVDFDGTLEDLERKLKEVAVKIQENPDDLMLHKQIEEIDGLIKKHPDYIKRQEEELQNWLEANQPKFQEALKEMRSILPENLAKLGNQEIQAHFKDKDRPRLANHIIKGKGAYIAICRCIHLSTIPKSFDIVELRAFYASLPDEFLADPNGSKRKWKKAILEKLRELTKKEDNNRLTKNEKRNSAYTATSASVSTGTASRGKARGGGPAGFNLAAALQTGRGGLKSSRGRGGPDLAAALQTGRGGLKPSGGRGRGGGPDLAAALKAGRGGLKSSRGRGGGIPNLSTLLLGGKSNLKKTPPPPEPSGPGKVNPSPQYPKGVTVSLSPLYYTCYASHFCIKKRIASLYVPIHNHAAM
mmetsp:Transcript_28952/g.35705  ORF Transcript_28952/g.35705 Transcript_28952/m.35705 type:complete len:844 (+) Transcript_28952:776-3307(+)